MGMLRAASALRRDEPNLFVVAIGVTSTVCLGVMIPKTTLVEPTRGPGLGSADRRPGRLVGSSRTACFRNGGSTVDRHRRWHL